MGRSGESGHLLVATNKRARHDYQILRTYEAGIVLVGTEVKSLRAGRVSLVDAFAQQGGREIMLHGLTSPSTASGVGRTTSPGVPGSCSCVGWRSIGSWTASGRAA